MKMQTKGIVLIGLALFLANALLAQQVKTDYDRAAHFSQYKTYSWKKVQTPDPLWVDRIKAGADATLAAKGWTKVESGGDISIVAIEINRDHQTLNTYYDDFGGGRRWRGFGGFAILCSITLHNCHGRGLWSVAERNTLPPDLGGPA